MNDMRTSFKFINIFYQLLGLGKDKKKDYLEPRSNVEGSD